MDRESHKSRKSEGDMSVRELRSEILLCRQIPPEILSFKTGVSGRVAKRPRLKAKMQRLEVFKEIWESTQDSLNKWDAVSLNSIPGVYVYDCIGSSISSVSPVTEPAISHLPQVGSDQFLNLTGRTQFIYSYDLYADVNFSSNSHSP